MHLAYDLYRSRRRHFTVNKRDSQNRIRTHEQDQGRDRRFQLLTAKNNYRHSVSNKSNAWFPPLRCRSSVVKSRCSVKIT